MAAYCQDIVECKKCHRKLYTSFDVSSLFYVEECWHLFCVPCIRKYIDDEFISKFGNLTCLADRCQKPLTDYQIKVLFCIFRVCLVIKNLSRCKERLLGWWWIWRNALNVIASMSLFREILAMHPKKMMRANSSANPTKNIMLKIGLYAKKPIARPNNAESAVAFPSTLVSVVRISSTTQKWSKG